MKSKLLILSAALMLVLAGCSGDKKSEFTPASSSQSQTVAVESVSLDVSSETLTVGDTLTLHETVLPANADNKAVNWSATGDGVVSVDGGVVTALKEGSSVVTVTTVDGAKTASCNITVSDALVNLQFSGEGDKAPNTWVYWNDQNWCGSTVAVNTATKQGKKVTLDYSVTAGHCEFGFQAFYKNSALHEGASYRLTAKINTLKAASAASKQVKINGTYVDLTVGDNEIAVKYLEPGATGSSFQFVVDTNLGDNKFVISDYEWEGILDTPSAIAVSDTFNLTFAPVDGAASYTVKYYDADKNYLDTESVTASGAALTKPASLADGNYYLTLTAVSALDPKYDSRPSDYTLFKVGGGEVVPAGGPKTNIVFGEENNLPLDTFVYWNSHRAWSLDSDVTIAEGNAYTEEGLLHVQYTADGTCDFGLQLFYKNSSLTNGTTYTVSFKMKAAVAASTYHVFNTEINKTLAADTWTEISYEYTEAANTASLKVIIPSQIATANTVELKDFAWTPKA